MVGPSWFPPIASVVHTRSLGCWCISTATLSPAATAQLAAAATLPFTLHVISCYARQLKRRGLYETVIRTALVTPLTGELLAGGRTQVLDLSTPLTQNSWNVACACAAAAKASVESSVEASILAAKGLSGRMGWSGAAMEPCYTVREAFIQAEDHRAS